MNADGSKKMYKANIKSLPDGTFILLNNNAYLIARNNIYLWSAGGYIKEEALPEITKVNVLTPESIVNTFRAGYTPQMK